MASCIHEFWVKIAMKGSRLVVLRTTWLFRISVHIYIHTRVYIHTYIMMMRLENRL
jgi:hypothetical protein